MINVIFKLYELCDLKKSKLFLFVFFSIIVTFFEVLSLSIIYPMVKVMLGETDVDYISNFPFIEHLNEYPLIIIFSLLLIFVFVTKNLITYLIRVWLAKFSWTSLVFLRKRVVNKYTEMDYEDFLDKGVVYINSAINEYTRIIIQGMESSLKLFGEVLILILITSYLFFLNIQLTSILLFFVSIISFFYYLLTFKKVISQGKDNQDGEKKLYSSSFFLFRGIKEIKILKKDNYLIDKLISGAKKISDANISNQKIKLIPRYLLEAVFIVFGCIFIIFAAKTNYESSEILSLISVYAFAALRLLPSVSQIGICINDINYALSPTNLIYEDVVEKAKKIKTNSNISGNLKLARFKSLELNNISFKYKNSDKKVLDKLSIKIVKDDFIGIIGPSGVGKSTLIDILLGYLKPSEGEVNLIDQKDNHIETNQVMSYLAQEPIIIQGSISENIRLSENENNVDVSKITEAIKFAELENFVKNLKNGNKTILGEGGINLSIGQKQRLALARCFYSEREIMILDEPSSALDEKTQDNIFNNLNFLKGKKTIILITHNHRTLKFCNKIFKFDDKTLKPYNLNEKTK